MFSRIPDFRVITCLLALILFSGCVTSEKIVYTSSGLIYFDNKTGTGREAEPGDSVLIHFKAWVVKDSTSVFKDESNDISAVSIGNTYPGKKPIEFVLGENTFIKGSDEGIAGMKIGGIRTMIIPPTLLYGCERKLCPPDSNIKLIVELLRLKKFNSAVHR